MNTKEEQVEAKSTARQTTDSAFDRVLLNDSTVRQMLEHGRSLEETIVALVCEKNRLVQRIVQLETIAPRKIALPDGRVLVSHCPDELVPIEPLNLG